MIKVLAKIGIGFICFFTLFLMMCVIALPIILFAYFENEKYLLLFIPHIIYGFYIIGEKVNDFNKQNIPPTK